MINTGRQYTLYYNAPKTIEATVIEEPNPCIDLGDRIEYAFRVCGKSIRNKAKKLSSKMKTRTSGILSEAAYAGTANLNYSDRIPENKARYLFSKIVKKEKRKSRIILGAEIFSLAIFYVPPLLFVPFTSIILGSAIAYQAATMRTLSKGIHNISFAPNPDVSNLERIIFGEKGLELAIPDLIEYRAAKGL